MNDSIYIDNKDYIDSRFAELNKLITFNKGAIIKNEVQYKSLYNSFISFKKEIENYLNDIKEFDKWYDSLSIWKKIKIHLIDHISKNKLKYSYKTSVYYVK